MAELIAKLNGIWHFIENLVTFPLRMYGLFEGFVPRIAAGLEWLPMTVYSMIVCMIAIAVIFKIFGREG